MAPEQRTREHIDQLLEAADWAVQDKKDLNRWRAIETLARVRKMSGREPIQINIAEQQVKVAG